jgi:outer membrane immunogenic protein
MRTLLTSALIVGAALVAGSAMAADMPAKAPLLMKAPPPAYSWTGCYIAGGGGYGKWTQDSFSETDPAFPPVTQFSQPTTSGGKGWFGTVGLGCDYQVISSIVIGAFGDWDFGDIKGQFSPAFQNIVGTESDKWSWAAGGRIGWLVTPTVLTYFTGGYTQTHFDVVNFNSLNFPIGGPAGLSLPANTYHGWFLGSGFEYAISFLPTGFFLKSEYRYATYEAVDLRIVDAFGFSPGAVNSKKDVQTVRSELVYRFNFSR